MSHPVAEQIAQQESRHPVRMAVAALALGTSVLTLAGCESGSSTSADQLVSAQGIGHYVFDSGEKSGDHNHAPAFRATTVEILDGGFLLGSGSLVKVNGSYELATAEHVARPALNLKVLVKEPDTPGVQGTDKVKKPGFSVPGVGVFKLPKQPDFVGKPRKDSSGSIDRLTLLPLTTDEEKIVEKAVKAGTIAVPEKVSFEAKFGDEFFMPLADTGKQMPFVYIGPGDAGKPNLVPLFLLDEGLDYTKGMEQLSTATRAAEAKLNREKMMNAKEAALGFALQGMQDKLWRKYQAKPGEASRWLPCMGDSGSPFVDKQGNVVGVLSAGEPFFDPTQKDSLSELRISRLSEDGTPDSGRSCLSSVILATGK